MQEEVHKEEHAASEGEAQAETHEEEPASDDGAEANSEENVEWQIVGKPRSPRPTFGRFKKWDGGAHAPEASEEGEEEEGPEAGQVGETIGEEDVEGSATASTNDEALDQEEEGQSSTSIGIVEGQEEEVEEEGIEDAPPVAAFTNELTAEPECVTSLLQQDPAIITASLSPTNSSSEPVNMSPQHTEGTQSPASAEEKDGMDELPKTSKEDMWPALPTIETWDDFIAQIPEVWSAEQIAAADAAATVKQAPAGL